MLEVGAVRNRDTPAGGIAQAYYREVPANLVSAVQSALTPEMAALLDRFSLKHRVPGHILILE